MKALLLLLSLAALALHAQDARTRSFLLGEAMQERTRYHNSAAFEGFRHVLERYPDCAEAHFFIVPYYMQMKQADRALYHAQRAVALAPGNYTYLEQQAAVYRQTGKQDETIDAYEQLWQADKSQADILRLLQNLYYRKGDTDKVIDVLGRIEQADGPSEQTTWMKSRLYADKGDKERSIAEMKKLADQYPADNDYRDMYADCLIANGREDEGLHIVRQILQEDSTHSAAQITLLQYYMAQEDSAKCDSVCFAVLANPKSSAKTVDAAAKIFIAGQRDTMQIVQLLDSARIVSQSYDVAMFEYAFMDHIHAPDSIADPVLQWMAEKAPDEPFARYSRVQKLWAAQNYDEVIRECDEARKYTPDKIAFYYFQGCAYMIKDRNDEALAAFRAGLGIITEDDSPEIVADFYVRMGDILHTKGRNEEAYAAYDSCLVWQPDDVECLNNYAYFLALDGKNLEQAEAMSHKTIKAKPDSPTYLDTYAWILFVQGRTKEARVYIDQALDKVESDKERATLQEHAGDIYANDGDIDKALDMWRKAAEQMPDNKILKKKINKKKYIRQ